MILCVAVDDNMGMMFNRRRQSQDKNLRKYLIALAGERKLWINSYTEGQFDTPLPPLIVSDDDFLKKAGANELCFVENQSLKTYAEKVSEVILLKWNRVYPADFYFDLPMPEAEWKLESTSEFGGNSHDKITVEVWKRENI